MGGWFNVYYKQWQTEEPKYDTVLNLLNDRDRDIIKLAKEKKILQVFSSGNEGMITPHLQAVLPSYDHELHSWLVVGSLNGAFIEKDNNNTIIIESSQPNQNTNDSSSFSNSFKGAVSYGIMAPRECIDSVNSYYNNETIKNLISLGRWTETDIEEFIEMSGTSQAAPMVSGAATLVAEKYPFLNGVQIADVLLSTANKDYI